MERKSLTKVSEIMEDKLETLKYFLQSYFNNECKLTTMNWNHLLAILF